MSLVSALNWYHKKIGAYDKKLWEKSVDQRILRGVCAIPRKTARIKTELIDVDLVQGSAFAKAKPQHSWVVTTVNGIKRILFLPLYFSWWQVQTNASLSCLFVVLYILQIFALYLYYNGEDKDLSDVPSYEVITPIVMMLILGVVHSQIVATFTTPKSRRKHIARTKRRRIKLKILKKSYNSEQDKSSPASDSASDYIPYNVDRNIPSQTAQMGNENPCSYTKCNTTDEDSFKSNGHESQCSTLNDPKSNDGCGLNYVNSVPNYEMCNTNENLNSENVNQEETSVAKARNFSEESYYSHISKDSAYMEYNSPSLESSELNLSNPSLSYVDTLTESDKVNRTIRQISKDSVFQSSVDKDGGKYSSDEEYFVAKKISYNSYQWKNYTEMKNNHCLSKKGCSKKHCLRSTPTLALRRYSDVGPVLRKSKQALLSLNEHRHSVDNIFSGIDREQNILPSDTPTQHQSYVHGKKRKKRSPSRLQNIEQLMELPIDVKNYSSSGMSGENSSPNTPSKNQTSDLEWPLITNTDCNSDSSGCSSECTKELSDVTPAENPFAWEMLERSKKLTCKDSTSSGKISCTIWEGSECKKADLTALDISSAIIQKVDSTHHSTEYLYIGVFFAVILSILPLMFRLKNGASGSDIQDVTTDVFNLSVPTSEDVVRITDGLIELMWGKGLSSKVEEMILQPGSYKFFLGPKIFQLLSVPVHEYFLILHGLMDKENIFSHCFIMTELVALNIAPNKGLILHGFMDKWSMLKILLKAIVSILMIERLVLSFSFFFLLSVAEKTFKQRFLYAKHFCYLTSSRGAKRSDLPHFRLNKVKNIKTWLSIRSYMKKLGPQRSVDVIVSFTFILEVCVVSYLCIQLLKETGQFADELHCWELMYWTIALGVYLLRFMIIGTKINRKYRNLSVLITEQINLYLHMEQKPHKKEELILANNVLKLAADLLKELESPFKISGLCANSYLYNITKVVVLSAFSAMLTDILGFKLKLYKIKIK